MKRSFPFALLTATLISAAAMLPAPAWAQAYRSQLHFLEEFAARQYDRGNIAGASKEFQRILRMDPDNAVARKYLEKIAAIPPSAASKSAPERVDQIITDISGVKNDLIEYEKDAKDLEYMIRNLITENDGLYQMLYKRSREVIEMREKFYGTPYASAYEDVMKDIPVDHVPQRLHPSNDILPDEPKAAINTSQDEVSGLMDDISASLNKKKVIGEVFYAPGKAKDSPGKPAKPAMPAKKPLQNPVKEPAKAAIGNTYYAPGTPAVQGTPGVPSALDITPELNLALQAQRDAMIERTLATSEKHQNLVKVRDELAGINASLKQADNRYMQALKKIDAYYSRIKNDMAKKNFTEQKMFNELVADYADKVKELEELKTNIRGRDNSLASYKTALVSNNARIEDVNKALLSKGDLLFKLKAMLIQYKNRLTERDAVIQKQQGDLALTDKSLTIISEQISGIEKTLGENGTQLDNLQEKITGIKGPLPRLGPDARAALQATAAEMKALQQELNSLGLELKEAYAPNEDSAKQALLQKVANLQGQLKGTTQDLEATDARFNQQTLREQNFLNQMEEAKNSFLREQAQKENAFRNERNAFRDEKSALLKQIAELKDIAKSPLKVKDENTRLSKTLQEAKAESDKQLKELDDKDAVIEDLNGQNTARAKRLVELSEQNALLQNNERHLHPPVELNYAKDTSAVSDLKAHLRRSTDKLEEAEALATRLHVENAGLAEKLAERDTLIEKLKAAATKTPAPAPVPAISHDADKSLLTKALLFKEEELTQVKQQLAEVQARLDAIPPPAPAAPITAVMAPAIVPAPPPAPLPVTVIVNNDVESAQRIRTLTMDIKEKDAKIRQLRDDLASTASMFKQAQDSLKSLNEKFSVQDIKQAAADKIIDARDDRIASMSTQIFALKQDLAAANFSQQELLARMSDADLSKTAAEGKLKARENEIADIQVKIKELQQDMKKSAALLEKKDRDNDATLAELKRVNDALEKKTLEIQDLQRRINAMKAP